MTQVLLVEDNALNRELVTDLLEVNGYQVVGVESAEEGLQRVHSQPPDVILMDIALPGLDGLSALRELKANPATQDIPVAMLSAHARQDDERAARAAGCTVYLSKPINTRTFVATVAALIATVTALHLPPTANGGKR